MINGLMLKTFIFENETTCQSSSFQLPVPMNYKTINIEQIIYIFKQMYSISDLILFKVYDPLLNCFVELNVQDGLDIRYFLSPNVFIKYRENILRINENNESKAEQTPDLEKKQRNKERSIREVIFCVKKWRQTHNTLTKTKTKINLQEAAKIVGIAKKSLDDYYSQLRLAQKYGFDFQKNIDKKIGVLRLFVKTHRQKDGFNIKYQKLPKKLRIIQQIDEKCKYPEYVKVEIQQQPQQTIMESSYLKTIPKKSCEQYFYKSFDFMLDDPDNPFNKCLNPPKKMQTTRKQQFLYF